MSNAILDSGETLLGLAEAVRPYKVHPATAARWCSQGAPAKSGVRVFLEHVRVGVKLKTSAEALKRFFNSLSGDTTAPLPAPKPRDRRNAAEAAVRELESLGC